MMSELIQRDEIKHTRLIALCLVCLAVALYYPALGQGFICDDYRYLSLFAELGDGLAYASGIPASQLFGYYRPVTDSVFALVEWSGGGAWLHHFVNILLHAVNSALALLLFQRFLHPLAAFMGALIFITLPVNVQAVAWVSGRPDLLAAFFSLLSLLALDNYLAGDRRSRFRLAIPVLLSFGAVGAKESAITFFLIAGILVMYRNPPGALKDASGTTAVFLLPPLMYVCIRLAFVQQSPQAAPNIDFSLLPVHFLLSLLAFFFRSIPGHVFGMYAPVVFGCFALGAFGAWTVWGLKSAGQGRHERIRGAVCILAVYSVLALAVVPIAGWPGPDLQRSRYFYLPGLAFAFAFASAAEAFAGSRNGKRLKVVAGAVIAMTVMFTLGARGHMQAYKEGAEFFDTITGQFIQTFPEMPASRIALFAPQEIKGVPALPFGFAEALRLRGTYGGAEFDIKTFPPAAYHNEAALKRLRSDNRLLLTYSADQKSFTLLPE